MTPPQEHPDRASERREERAQEELTREQVKDLEERHAPRVHSSPGEEAPRVSSAMVVLAWQVLHGCDHDRRDACKVLAQEVLEADDDS